MPELSPISKPSMKLRAASWLIALAACSSGLGFSKASALTLCDMYPTRCRPYDDPMAVGPLKLQGYPGNSPIYTPGQLVPALGMVTQNAWSFEFAGRVAAPAVFV